MSARRFSDTSWHLRRARQQACQALCVPASFAKDLLGRRSSGHPNTSDKNDDQSRVLGHHLLEVLDVPPATGGPADPGSELERRILEHLRKLRPDLNIERSRPAADFAQYAHLKVFRDFHKKAKPLVPVFEPIQSLVGEVTDGRLRGRLKRAVTVAERQAERRDAALVELRQQMPEESLLKVDITVSGQCSETSARLDVAFSCKWTLRTDRAQDCLSQGAKLVSLRRGPMPHYAVITMEPRPAMLRILGDGSGALDCVYHLHLPGLLEAVDRAAKAAGEGPGWSPARTLRRLVDQGRLRDYDDLVHEVTRLPVPSPVSGP